MTESRWVPLLEPTGPFVHTAGPLGIGIPPGLQAALGPRRRVFEFDSRLLESYESLYRELGRRLAFPDSFRPNLDALIDVMEDLSWIDSDGIVLIFRNAESLLRTEPAESRGLLMKVFDAVGSQWGDYVIARDLHGGRLLPFHVILELDEVNQPPEWVRSESDRYDTLPPR